MLVKVWLTQNETLPDNCGDLFAHFVDSLLIRERLARFDDARQVVHYTPAGTRRIADEGAQGSDAGVLTVTDRSEALASLGDEGLLKKAQDAILLKGETEIRFRHQLQEYFTALCLKQRLERRDLAASTLWLSDKWWARSGWEESAVQLAGLYAKDCTPVIRWLADAQPKVAAKCLLESGALVASRASLFKDLHDRWLPRLTDVEGDPDPQAPALSATPSCRRQGL